MISPTIPLSGSATRPRLLHAEDTPEIAYSVALVLRAHGWDVTSVEDGTAALACVAAERFDVVLTDHNMPRLDGLGLVEALRSVGYDGRIVVFSGWLRPEMRAAYERLRVDGFAQKPASAATLLALLASVSQAGWADPGGSIAERKRACFQR